MREGSVGGYGRGWLAEAGRLVVPLHSDRAELRFVPAAVVAAEQEFTLGEGDSDVRLGAATVAAVEGSQRAGSESSSHVAYLLIDWPPRRSVVLSCFRTNMKPLPEVPASRAGRGSLYAYKTGM